MTGPTTCPSCSEVVDVPDRYRGWRVRCPVCRHEFTAEGSPAGPGRANRRTERTLTTAREEVAAPAAALRVLGWLGTVFGALAALSLCGFGAWAVEHPVQAQQQLQAENDEVVAAAIVFWWVWALSVAVCGPLIAIGARKLSRLETGGWITAAAVCGMIPSASCCWPVGLPIGIWTLIVLSRPDVRAGFEVVAEHGPQE